ncbi:MAG TPA: hypothetical protein PLT82_03035 [Candidatus Hydrogenedens sp.]|nr:hypothetical protein [Candidatus Hydrogenedens sp.]HOL19095.1 hypothetical protein [Candidatus Hydrogenedens sp.]HPP58087.1 hypothetical protein [Candidatus Hydrogenedens sp.]
MKYYKCDGCGKILKQDELRYRIKIEGMAIYEQNEIHLADLIRDHQDEISDLIKKMENMSPDELEEQIYKNFEFDLCPACYKIYIRNPIILLKNEYLEKDNANGAIERFLNSLKKPE